MARFFGSLLLFVGLLLVVSIPVVVVGWRKRRIKVVRGFLIAAGLVALFSATVSASSRRLVEQCEAAGNPNCFDTGAAGLQLLAVAVYAIIAWVAAIVVYKD